MRRFKAVSILTLILVSVFTAGGRTAEDSTALLRLKLTRHITYSDLVARGVDIVAAYPDNSVDIAVNDIQRSWIESRNPDYKVLETRKLRAVSALDSNLGNYHTYAESEAALDSLSSLFPELTRIDTLGATIEGRYIRGIKISDNADIDEDEPEVLIMGCHHARELMSVEVPLLFAQHLLGNYGISSEVTGLIDDREIWIVPIVNPDGHVYVQNNHSGDWWTWWRKNRRDNGDGTFGVDLNRNYGYMWAYDDDGSSPSTSSVTYRGVAPFSEPETQAVRDFCAARSFSVALSYHSYSELIIYPWGYDAVYTDDHEFFTAFADSLKRGNDYKPGCTATGILYPTNGDSDDWAYGETASKNRFFCYTIELNSYEEGGFGPPDSLIGPTFDKVLEANLTLLRRAGNPFSVLGPQVPTLSEVTPLAEPDYMLDWTGTAEGDENPPDGYRVVEYKGLGGTIDQAETEDALWELEGFSASADRAFSGGYSYYSGMGNSLDNWMEMATVYPANLGDTVSCMLWYDIESNWDYAYFEASFDQGLTWVTVPGDVTTGYDPNGSNRGNGITGASGGWIEADFYLDGVPGFGSSDVLYLRFSYITDSYVEGEGIYVDDIDPVAFCERKDIVASAVQDTFHVIRPYETGDYAYQVIAFDSEGHESRASNMVFHSVLDLTDDQLVPNHATALRRNYPNPFNPSTTISFSIGESEADGSGKIRVVMDIFDAEGRKVASVLDESLPAGEYTTRWNGRGERGTPLASGVYFIRLGAGDVVLAKKIILLR